MDLMRIAESIVSGPEVTAAANPEVAKAIAALIKQAIGPLLEQMKPDFGHDALSSGVRGMSDAEMSFPVRPDVFNSQNLNGNLLVKITLDPPVQGSGKAIAGTKTRAKFVVCYYFKTPVQKGSGKCMWDAAAGEVGITFDANGNPKIDDEGDLVDLVVVMEELTDRVISGPPPGAKSLSRDPQHRKEQSELNEIARQEKAQQERQVQQDEAARSQKETDKLTHGSVEAFVVYMDEQDEDHFGPADLQKLLNTMFGDPATRAMSQVRIKQECEAEGLVFDPKKRHLSSRRPKLDLLKITARVSAR
jgi:hypothetical protein